MREATGSSVVNGILTLPGFPGGHVTSISGVEPSDYEGLESRYFEAHGGYNPMMGAVQHVMETGRVLRASDHVAFTELRDTPYFQELLHPLNADYAAGIVVESAPHGTSWLSLSRPVGASDFSSTDMALLQELSGPLQRVCRLLGELPDGALEWEMLDACGVRAAVTDAELRIRRSTTALDEMLASRSLFTRTNGALRGTDKPAERELLGLARHALRARSSPVVLDEAPRRRLCDRLGNHWSVTAMAGAPGLSCNELLFLFRRSTRQETPENRLIAKYGLTISEARCLLGLLQAPDGVSLAKLLDVSTNTVKTHLRNCAAKTGARNRVALITLLAREGLVGN